MTNIMTRWRAELNGFRQKQAQEQLWAGARTYADLRELMARFCEGELTSWPGHDGPRDEETVPIGAVLAHVNRRGFLTTQSQPGDSDDVENTHPYYPATWEQRAAVQGFADDAAVDRLETIVQGTRLVVQARIATRWRMNYSSAVTMTLVNGHDYAKFGAAWSRRDIRFIFSGIAGHLHTALGQLNQVLIYDPYWGDHDLLWERLRTL